MLSSGQQTHGPALKLDGVVKHSDVISNVISNVISSVISSVISNVIPGR